MCFYLTREISYGDGENPLRTKICYEYSTTKLICTKIWEWSIPLKPISFQSPWKQAAWTCWSVARTYWFGSCEESFHLSHWNAPLFLGTVFGTKRFFVICLKLVILVRRRETFSKVFPFRWWLSWQEEWRSFEEVQLCSSSWCQITGSLIKLMVEHPS